MRGGGFVVGWLSSLPDMIEGRGKGQGCGRSCLSQDAADTLWWWSGGVTPSAKVEGLGGHGLRGVRWRGAVRKRVEGRCEAGYH